MVKRISEFKKKREMNQPYDKPTCGSVFRNPGDDQFAGKLVDNLGLKGLKEGGAEISRKHANFIVNNKDATAIEVRGLINKMKDSVKDQNDIELEEEIEYIGEWK